MKELGDYICDGQMNIFDFLQNENQKVTETVISEKGYKDSVSAPCGRECDVEWCSRTCFERRGRIWDYAKHKWMRNIKGEIIKLNNPECDWEP